MTSNVDLSKVDKMAQDAYNLSEAYRFKEQANVRYSEKDYALCGDLFVSPVLTSCSGDPATFTIWIAELVSTVCLSITSI
ncbi:hypothetical protein WUBG_18254 [Wuchereria bancrofti]|uniref:Uncharacterized protein n=1 Tax=Wuchereria bancrofti TaxID=6293 RepID=J9E657_WUCBA|nr:hypothetical protein WUBG_18254 [Wuchereria bancrofti]